MSKRTMTETEEKCVTIASTVGAHMNQEGVHPMARAVQGMVEQTTLSKYAGARIDTCQQMGKEKYEEQLMTCSNMMKIQSWQHRSLM